MPHIQICMLHTLTYTKLTVRGTSKNETLRQKRSYTRSFNFPIISLSWYDIPELVVPIRIFLIEDYCSANKEATEPRAPIYNCFKLKSSLRKFYVATMTWLTVMEYLCHKWPGICSTCCKHFPVLSSFTTYYWVCN